MCVCYLQVHAQEGLAFGELIVVPHEQVEQGSGLGPQRAQLGHAAGERLAAQRLAQRHPTLEQHHRELERRGRGEGGGKRGKRGGRWRWREGG